MSQYDGDRDTLMTDMVVQYSLYTLADSVCLVYTRRISHIPLDGYKEGYIDTGTPIQFRMNFAPFRPVNFVLYDWPSFDIDLYIKGI